MNSFNNKEQKVEKAFVLFIYHKFGTLRSMQGLKFDRVWYKHSRLSKSYSKAKNANKVEKNE